MKRGRIVRRAVMLLVLGLVVEYLLLPQIAGVRHSFHLLTQVRFRFVAAGLALEALALIAYAMLTRSLLPRASRVGLLTALRIDLSTLALSHVVPAGTAGGTALGYRLLTNEGVSGEDTGFALAMQGLGSAVVLNVILWLGLIASIPTHGFNALYVTAAIIGAVLIGGFSAAVLMLTKGEERAARFVRTAANKVPFLDGDRLAGVARGLSERLRALAADRAMLRRAIGWATANWLLDAASLWVFLFAFRAHVGVIGLIVAYGLANVLAAIPVTPGGLGIVEGVLVPTLVGFGSTRGAAILGVIGWRLVQFWLPIPVGALAYVSGARRRDRAPRREAIHEFEREAARIAASGETARDWAERHGVKVHPRGAPPGARET